MFKRTVEGYPYEEFKYCECGCQKTIHKENYNSQECYFIKNHDKKGKSYWKGRKHSEDAKKKIGEAHKGEKNPMFGRKGELSPTYVGDRITTKEGIHYRMRQLIPKPEVCEMCKSVPPFELSNKDHKYRQVKDDWQWLCICCHRIYDNNYERNFKKWNENKNRGSKQQARI